MTDQQIIKLLRTIYDLALLPYPYPEASTNSESLAFALGQIGGIASRAIAEFESAGVSPERF